jgi:hypothetical protein
MGPESRCRAWKDVDTIRKNDAVYCNRKLIGVACDSIKNKMKRAEGENRN